MRAGACEMGTRNAWRQAIRFIWYAPVTFEHYTPEVEAKFVDAMEECGAQAVAWGECGLDYYRRHEDAQANETKGHMQRVFTNQVKLAVSKGWPLIVHEREPLLIRWQFCMSICHLITQSACTRLAAMLTSYMILFRHGVMALSV